MIEVLVSVLIASVVMVSGMAFFAKAFMFNYRISDYVLAHDKSSSMVEEMQIYAISSNSNDANQSPPGNIIDWRIERIENGWIAHIAAISDRIEKVPGITAQTPALVQLFCFSMWPMSQADAFNIYAGGYQQMWNLDVGGTVAIPTSCMTVFNNLNRANNMTSIRLKTAYARFAYETR